MFEALEITYRVIDERINILVQSGALSTRYVLQYESGKGSLDTSTVDDVRHLLLMSGFDPRD